jgi:4-amino-4-deoxy-L-arabinose transferase-like glycosyltransferase
MFAKSNQPRMLRASLRDRWRAESRSRVTADRAGAAAAVMLAFCTLAIGGYRLGDLPPVRSVAEQEIEREARTLAETGHGTRGEVLPVFFPTATYPAGRDPIPVYVTALFAVAFPAVSAARIATVLLAAINVLLVYVIARQVCRRHLAAVAAAMFTAASPAHVVLSRAAVTALYPVVFVSLSLWCLVRWTTGHDPRWAVVGGFVLGAGLFSHPLAIVLMPLVLAIMLAAIARTRRHVTWAPLLPLAGFAVPFLLWLMWSWSSGDRLSALANHYRLYDATALNYLQGVKDMTSYFGLSVRSYIYWQYFSPSLMFFGGEPATLNSVRHIGLLLIPVMPLLAAGVYRITIRRGDIDLVLLAGMLCAPVAAALEPSLAVRRVLVMLPFVAIIAGIGLDDWLARPRWRVAALAALVLAGLQFLWFAGRYFG